VRIRHLLAHAVSNSASAVTNETIVIALAAGVTMASPTPVSRTRRVRVATRCASSIGRLTDTALCESLRLKLAELSLGDRSRVEKLFGRRDLIGARAATARGDN
jgi:hypothetical protein